MWRMSERKNTDLPVQSHPSAESALANAAQVHDTSVNNTSTVGNRLRTVFPAMAPVLAHTRTHWVDTRLGSGLLKAPPSRRPSDNPFRRSIGFRLCSSVGLRSVPGGGGQTADVVQDTSVLDNVRRTTDPSLPPPIGFVTTRWLRPSTNENSARASRLEDARASLLRPARRTPD